MNLLTILLCLVLGIVMTFHASMNARIGTLTGNALFTNLVFWILGAIVAIIFYLVSPSRIRFFEVMKAPIWLYAAGIIGAFVSLGIIYLIPRAGIAVFTVLILAGQLLCSSLMSSGGILADTAVPFGTMKILGFVLVFAGGVLVVTR